MAGEAFGVRRLVAAFRSHGRCGPPEKRRQVAALQRVRPFATVACIQARFPYFSTVSAFQPTGCWRYYDQRIRVSLLFKVEAEASEGYPHDPLEWEGTARASPIEIDVVKKK